MGQIYLRAGDICLITFNDGGRWIGKFVHCTCRTNDYDEYYFFIFDLENGFYTLKVISEGNTLIKSIEPVDSKVWDKAVKVRDVYLKALGAIVDACEREQPKTAASEMKEPAIDGGDSNT